MGVAQPQPQTQQTRDSQLNHVAGAETNTNSHVISNPLTLSTNDSNGTSASTQESTFICTEYELDLVLSVALVGDKEQYAYDQAGVTATTDNTEPVRADSQTQNDER